MNIAKRMHLKELMEAGPINLQMLWMSEKLLDNASVNARLLAEEGKALGYNCIFKCPPHTVLVVGLEPDFIRHQSLTHCQHNLHGSFFHCSVTV